MTQKDHRFWKDQPVGMDPSNGPLQKLAHASKEPLPLPHGLRFATAAEHEYPLIHRFLRDNYVEDSSGVFRLIYSPALLHGEFTCPNTRPEYCVTVKENSAAIVGFMFAKEHAMVLAGRRVRLASVNYLCVARELRDRGLAPVLIAEIRRRVNLRGIASAIFTGAVTLPFRLCQARYFHRILDCEYLISSGFINYYVGYEPLRERTCRRAGVGDMEQVRALFSGETGLSVYEEFSEEWVMGDRVHDASGCDVRSHDGVVVRDKCDMRSHDGVPGSNGKDDVQGRDGQSSVMQTFVLVEDGTVVAFGSFYVLDSLNVKKNKVIRTAHLKHLQGPRMRHLLAEMIDIAHGQGMHVFNALGLAGRDDMLGELGFVEGTGRLNYYLFNYAMLPLTADEINVVLF